MTVALLLYSQRNEPPQLGLCGGAKVTHMFLGAIRGGRTWADALSPGTRRATSPSISRNEAWSYHDSVQGESRRVRFFCRIG
jgi:hypothetical protein